MLDKELVADVTRRTKNPVYRSPERTCYAIAVMTAESLKLSGINTTPEHVLKSAAELVLRREQKD